MPLGDIRTNPETGETWRLDQVGNARKWTRIEGEEAANAQIAAQRGMPGAAIQGLLRGATFGAASGGGVGEAQQRQFPTTSLIGELLPDVALLAAGGGAALAGRRAGTSAGRVVEGIQKGREARRANQLTPSLSERLGGRGTTAGSAARIVTAVAEAVPGAQLVPIRRMALNQRKTNRAYASVFGLPESSVARAAKGARTDIQDEILETLETEYATHRGAITDAMSEPFRENEIRSLMEEAAESGLVSRELKKQVLTEGAPLDGQKVQQFRSRLAKTMRGAGTDPVLKDTAGDLLSATDNAIQEILEELAPEAAEAYRLTNQRYRIWATLREGAGISPDGQIMSRTANNRLRKAFGDQFRAGRELAGQDPAIQNFLDIVQEGAELNVGLQSSGTAERAVGAAVSTGIIGSLASQ